MKLEDSRFVGIRHVSRRGDCCLGCLLGQGDCSRFSVEWSYSLEPPKIHICSDCTVDHDDSAGVGNWFMWKFFQNLNSDYHPNLLVLLHKSQWFERYIYILGYIPGLHKVQCCLHEIIQGEFDQIIWMPWFVHLTQYHKMYFIEFKVFGPGSVTPSDSCGLFG